MTSKFLFQIGQQLRGRIGNYSITKQVSEFIYFAAYVLVVTYHVPSYTRITVSSNEQAKTVVIKSVLGHWRLQNERDIIQRFQARVPTLRPLLDEIEAPIEPPAIVLRYLDDDVTRASRKQRLTRQEIKIVAKCVLEALQTLHEDGYVHTDIKPSNILVNYGHGDNRFSEVQLADCGGTVATTSEFAEAGTIVGTSLFRAPEVHLEIPWNTSSDIWSFGVTLINLIWAFDFHIFELEEPQGHEWYGFDCKRTFTG